MESRDIAIEFGDINLPLEEDIKAIWEVFHKNKGHEDSN